MGRYDGLLTGMQAALGGAARTLTFIYAAPPAPGWDQLG